MSPAGGRLVGYLLLAALFVGCASPPDSDPAATSSSPVQATAEVGASDEPDTGTIDGTVTDDELLPIAGATVGLIRRNVQVETDEGGKFRFTNVPAGKHAILAQRVGYETSTQSVDVQPGETTKVALQLKAVEVAADPYLEMRQRKALHNFGGFLYVGWAMNQTGNSPHCDACVWTTHVNGKPSHMMIEIFGRHAVSNPAHPDADYFWIWRNSYPSGTNFYECDVLSSACNLPIRVTFNDTHIDKTKVFWHQINCDMYWICFQEPRDIYTTFFYGYTELPPDYSARPK